MITVNFATDPQRPAVFACRVCGASAEQARACLAVEGPLGQHELFACTQCHSFYFDGPDPVIGYEGGTSETFWLDYVQAGAGIMTMLAPLTALDNIPEGDLIDVGCGFGFVVAYWQQRAPGSLGLESSYYGEVGRRKLGVDIRPQMLDAYRRSDPKRQFSIIYSSEVIEHTPDPEAFLDDLVAMLAPHSILILTTPSTTAITQNGAQAKLIAALSPGFHYAILSREIMAQMLERRNLNYEISVHDGQMIVWASRAPLPKISYGRTDWRGYFDFLEKLALHEDPHLATGALVRLLKDGMNSGHPQIASAAWDRLVPMAQKTYGINLLNPDINALMQLTAPLQDLDKHPSWLGNALLFGALHVGHHLNDRRTKLRMLDAALSVLARRADVDLQFGQEAQSFLSFAKTQYLIALSEALTVNLLAPHDHDEPALRASFDVLQQVLSAPPPKAQTPQREAALVSKDS